MAQRTRLFEVTNLQKKLAKLVELNTNFPIPDHEKQTVISISQKLKRIVGMVNSVVDRVGLQRIDSLLEPAKRDLTRIGNTYKTILPKMIRAKLASALDQHSLLLKLAERWHVNDDNLDTAKKLQSELQEMQKGDIAIHDSIYNSKTVEQYFNLEQKLIENYGGLSKSILNNIKMDLDIVKGKADEVLTIARNLRVPDKDVAPVLEKKKQLQDVAGRLKSKQPMEISDMQDFLSTVEDRIVKLENSIQQAFGKLNQQIKQISKETGGNKEIEEVSNRVPALTAPRTSSAPSHTTVSSSHSKTALKSSSLSDDNKSSSTVSDDRKGLSSSNSQKSVSSSLDDKKSLSSDSSLDSKKSSSSTDAKKSQSSSNDKENPSPSDPKESLTHLPNAKESLKVVYQLNVAHMRLQKLINTVEKSGDPNKSVTYLNKLSDYIKRVEDRVLSGEISISVGYKFVEKLKSILTQMESSVEGKVVQINHQEDVANKYLDMLKDLVKNLNTIMTADIGNGQMLTRRRKRQDNMSVQTIVSEIIDIKKRLSNLKNNLNAKPMTIKPEEVQHELYLIQQKIAAIARAIRGFLMKSGIALNEVGALAGGSFTQSHPCLSQPCLYGGKCQGKLFNVFNLLKD